jgi:glycosyltransferase involved in cell wall biosynthesis
VKRIERLRAAEDGGRVKVAYITTGYPHVSHTFVQREVRGLRASGVQVDTFAVSKSSPEELRSAADREEFAKTYAIRPPRPAHFIGAHARALLTRPGRWCSTLAVSLGGAREGGPKQVLWRFFYFVQAVVLWDRVRRTGAQHVHAHFANVASDLAWLATEIGGPGWTWSFTMHGPTEFADQRAHLLKEKASSASFVICISDFARSQLMGLVGHDRWGRLEVVHCAVDTSEFAPPPVRSADDGRLAVLCVARMVSVKGHAVLLEALAQVVARGVDVKATFIGDGPERKTLEALAATLDLADRVTFTGAVGQDDIRRYFVEADVFVLPSFAEGVPVVLMEAMAMQLPVVASRIAGIGELIDDGVHGRLLSPGRVDVLADALADLAADPGARERYGRAGRDRVSADFELATCVASLKNIYEERIAMTSAPGPKAAVSALPPD